MTLFNAWEAQRQQNEEKVRESQREGVTGKESSLFGSSSDQIRLFSDSGMLVYETGKLPPSVDGWGLSDRADYLYFTTRTHVFMHAYHTVCTQKHAKTGYVYTHFLSHTVNRVTSHTHCHPMVQITPGRFTLGK